MTDAELSAEPASLKLARQMLMGTQYQGWMRYDARRLSAWLAIATAGDCTDCDHLVAHFALELISDRCPGSHVAQAVAACLDKLHPHAQTEKWFRECLFVSGNKVDAAIAVYESLAIQGA